MEEFKSGIYKITCLKNNMSYVGQAKDIQKRFVRHIRSLNKNKHYNKHLQNSWNKYGEKNFIFEVIENCTTKKLNEREIYWIYTLDTFKNGFNQTCGGGGALGKKHEDGWLKMVLSASNAITSKPVIQIDSNNGEIISRYGSMSEASRVFGISPTAIQLCVEGKNKRACGYYWVLEEEYNSFKFSPFKNETILSVCQIDIISGKLLEIFDSLSDASRNVKTISSSITDCCRGRQKSCAGYFWKYYENGDENKEDFEVPIRKESKIKVVQLSLEGEFIRLFDSRIDAERKTGICSTSISQVCKGVYKQTNGYKWMNYEDYIEKCGEII